MWEMDVPLSTGQGSGEFLLDFCAQNCTFWCILVASFIAVEHHLFDVFHFHLLPLLDVKCQWLLSVRAGGSFSGHLCVKKVGEKTFA